LIFGAFEKGGEDLRKTRLDVAPFLTVPFLQQLIVRNLLHHVFVLVSAKPVTAAGKPLAAVG
jgi:hypothetical protein